MQVGENEKEYLPCRTRYYQSKMDGELLAKGKSYRYLKNTIIIFICTFDPFGLNLSKYTLVTKCVEAPDMSVNNRTRTIFFNTKGDRKGLTERQIAFLDYVDGKGASDEFLINSYTIFKTFQRINVECEEILGISKAGGYNMSAYFISMNKFIDIIWNEANAILGTSRGSAAGLSKAQ